MTIRYKCEECGAALNINDELAGTEGSCPRCHVEFVVPSADAVSAKPAKVEKPRSTGSLSTEEEIGDFLSSDEIPAATGRTSLAESDEDGSYAEDNPFEDAPARSHKQPSDADDAADDDEEIEVPSKKKSGKSQDGAGGAKKDSVDTSAFAKSLMGKGQPIVQEVTTPGKKRKRRQFGEGSDRPAGEITSYRDIVTYFAKIGWPAVVGFVVVIGLCVWVYSKMQKKLDVPPLAYVTGTIKIDGKPVAGGTRVQFIPVESSKNLKLGASEAFTDSNGKYTLQYSADFMGAVIGKHYVLVMASDPSHPIPARYSVTSDLQKEVGKDGKAVDIELKSDPVPEAEQ
jgi:hypothetical protein